MSTNTGIEMPSRRQTDSSVESVARLPVIIEDDSDNDTFFQELSMMETGSSSISSISSSSSSSSDASKDDKDLVLPPEVWARVMEYSDFETVLSCGATCRSMKDAIPLLKKICIDKASQINMSVASRFHSIEEIHINSLLILDSDNECMIDFETGIRVVPFLSRFASLQLVHFGGKDEDGNDIVGFSPVDSYFDSRDAYPNDGPRESLLSFLDSLSGAYGSGLLSKQLKVSGLCCPLSCTRRNGTSTCKTCLRACKSFPLESVVEFECRGSSSANASLGRMFSLDVCLERAHIESIIEMRPLGSQFLRSDKRLLYLLSTGKRFTITSEGGGTLHILKYSKLQLDEIKRVTTYAGLDMKKLSTQTLSNAIMMSFTNNGTMPPEDQCYISESSLEQLALPIDKEYFETPLLEHAEQFAWVLSQPTGTSYQAIQLDCLKLIRKLSEVENNPPIQQITRVIPNLASWLDEGTTHDYQLEAALVLKNMIFRGTDDIRKKVFDTGAVTKFSRLLSSRKDCIIKVALLCMESFIHEGSTLPDSVVPNLTKLLESKDEHYVNSALSMLVDAKDSITTTTRSSSSLLGHLLRMIKAPEQSGTLNCSILLRTLFEANRSRRSSSLTQKVIETKSTPRLVTIINTTQVSDIKMNMTHVMISLMTGSEGQVKVIVKEDGVLDILVDLIFSQDDDKISERVITTVGQLYANHHDRLQEKGMMKSLLLVLENNASTSVKKAASWTFAECCRVEFTEDITPEETVYLKVASQLLANDKQTEVLVNACWALFNILNGLKDKFYLNQVVVTGLVDVRQLLKLLPDVQLPALKSIHLISSGDDVCIKAILDCNGVVTVSKMLADSSENMQLRELSCCTISNLLADDMARIRTIDNDAIPGLLRMIKGSKENREHALNAMQQMIKNGDYSQIKYLVSENCANQLCGMLTADLDTSLVAITALKHIVSVGLKATNKKKIMPSKLAVFEFGKGASNEQMIESKLDMLISEIHQIKQATELVDQLRQKKSWLEFHIQNDHTQSLVAAIETMKEQCRQTATCFDLFGSQVGKEGGKEAADAAPLELAFSALRLQGDETKQCFDKHITNLEGELSTAKTKLDQLRKIVEKGTELKEWNEEQLAKDDLAAELFFMSNQLGASKSNLCKMKAMQSSKRKEDFDSIGIGIHQLFFPKENHQADKENNVLNITQQPKANRHSKAKVSRRFDKYRRRAKK